MILHQWLAFCNRLGPILTVLFKILNSEGRGVIVREVRRVGNPSGGFLGGLTEWSSRPGVGALIGRGNSDGVFAGDHPRDVRQKTGILNYWELQPLSIDQDELGLF